MDSTTNGCIAVVAEPASYGVNLTLGDTLIKVRTPRAATDSGLTDEQVWAAALRNARRGLEVALEEIGLALG